MVRMYANQIEQPDIAGALSQAESIKSNRLRNKLAERELSLKEEKIGRQNRLREVGGQYLSGDKDAYGELASMDPKYALELKQGIQKLDESQRKRAKEEAEYAGRLAQGVLSMPQMQRAQAYPEMRQRLESRGIDVSFLPEQYSPEAGQALQFMSAEAQTMDQLLGPDPTAAQRNVEAAMDYPEGDPRRQSLLNQGKTTIRMPEEEKAFSKERGKNIAEKVGEVESRVDSSRQLLQNYQQIGELLDDPSVYTGTGAGAVQYMKKAGQTLFGMDMEGVAEGEVSEKVRGAAVGKIREMVGDARMSDADRQFYLDIIPNLGDSPEGVQLAVEVMREAAQANMAREEKLQEFLSTYDGDADKAWREFRSWERGRPIWSDELMNRARETAEEGTTPRGPGAGIDPEVQGLIDKYTGGEQ